MTSNIYEVPNNAEIDGLASSYDAGTFIDEHSHAVHQVVHAISGALRVHASEATWFVPPGRGLWIPAHEPHSIRCLRKVEMRTVYLGAKHPSDCANVKVFSVSPLLREILVRISEGCADRQIPALKSLLLDEIAVTDVEQFRLPVPKDDRIARMASYLLENPTEHNSLENWAKHLGFSQRNLIRCIRAETGMSFRELRRQTRVMLAIEKLSDCQSVTNVAWDVGFGSTSAFIHAFRLITGSTPRKFVPR